MAPPSRHRLCPAAPPLPVPAHHLTGRTGGRGLDGQPCAGRLFYILLSLFAPAAAPASDPAILRGGGHAHAAPAPLLHRQPLEGGPQRRPHPGQRPGHDRAGRADRRISPSRDGAGYGHLAGDRACPPPAGAGLSLLQGGALSPLEPAPPPPGLPGPDPLPAGQSPVDARLPRPPLRPRGGEPGGAQPASGPALRHVQRPV